MKIDEYIDKTIESLRERLEKEKNIDLSKSFIVLSAMKYSAVRKEVWKDRNGILDRYRKLKDECRKQRKEIKKQLKLVRKRLKSIAPTQELLDSIEDFNSANTKLKAIEKGIDKAMNDVKKGYCSVSCYRLNLVFNILGALFLIPFFIGAGFLKVHFDWLYWWIVIPFMIIPLAFGAWKVFYLKKYLQWISADNQSKLSVWLINGSTALFLVWGYFAIACFFGLVNPYYYVIPLLVLLLVKILGQIYDFFVSSKVFNVTNQIFWLVLSILVAFSLVGGQIDSAIIQYFVRIALVVTCLVLTAMVLKACLLDKQVFEDYKSVLNFVIMLTLTIGLTVFAGYVFFWNKNGVEQSLFSAIMSIYAAVLGGAITLGGVAWTIRRQDEIRKEEEKKKHKPFILQISDIDEDIQGIAIEIKKLKNFNENFNNYQKNNKYRLPDLLLKNTSSADCLLCGIKINSAIYDLETKSYIEKEKIFRIAFNPNILTIDEELKHLSIIVEDILGNRYKFPCKAEPEERMEGDISGLCVIDVKITDIGLACDINEEDCNAKY